VVDVSDFKTYCTGYGAATFFLLVAFLTSMTGAFVKSYNYRIVWFFLSVTSYILGYVCYIGGLSDVACETKDDSDAQAALCDGYASSTVFYFLAVILFSLTAWFARYETTHERATMVYFTGLAFVSLAQFCFSAGTSVSACDLKDQNDDVTTTTVVTLSSDDYDIKCKGYGFAATAQFFSFFAMGFLIIWELIGRFEFYYFLEIARHSSL